MHTIPSLSLRNESQLTLPMLPPHTVHFLFVYRALCFSTPTICDLIALRILEFFFSLIQKEKNYRVTSVMKYKHSKGILSWYFFIVLFVSQDQILSDARVLWFVRLTLTHWSFRAWENRQGTFLCVAWPPDWYRDFLGIRFVQLCMNHRQLST